MLEINKTKQKQKRAQKKQYSNEIGNWKLYWFSVEVEPLIHFRDSVII